MHIIPKGMQGLKRECSYQNPDGDMPLWEKFRAARCSRPGCSPAQGWSISFKGEIAGDTALLVLHDFC